MNQDQKARLDRLNRNRAKAGLSQLTWIDERHLEAREREHSDSLRFDAWAFDRNLGRVTARIHENLTGEEADYLTDLDQGCTEWACEEHGQSDTCDWIVVPHGSPEPTPWQE